MIRRRTRMLPSRLRHRYRPREPTEVRALQCDQKGSVPAPVREAAPNRVPPSLSSSRASPDQRLLARAGRRRLRRSGPSARAHARPLPSWSECLVMLAERARQADREPPRFNCDTRWAVAIPRVHRRVDAPSRREMRRSAVGARTSALDRRRTNPAASSLLGRTTDVVSEG